MTAQKREELTDAECDAAIRDVWDAMPPDIAQVGRNTPTYAERAIYRCAFGRGRASQERAQPKEPK